MAHVLSAIRFLNYTKESGLFVLHKCDNRACVNPHHLFLGTRKENHDDMVRKGRERYARGTQINTVVLTEQDVREIKKNLKNGEKHRQIAKKYGVCPGTISKIACGKNWKWVS
jgi:DNA-binding NarL/FixJ family response regulator